LPMPSVHTPAYVSGRWPFTWPALGFWLFVLVMPFTYVIFAAGGAPDLFVAFFLVPLAIALAPLLTRHGRAAARIAMHALAMRLTLAEVRSFFFADSPSTRALVE
jgi:hypothetical protein